MAAVEVEASAAIASAAGAGGVDALVVAEVVAEASAAADGSAAAVKERANSSSCRVRTIERGRDGGEMIALAARAARHLHRIVCLRNRTE